MCSLQEAYSIPSFDTVNSKKQLGCTGTVSYENTVPVSNGSSTKQVGEYQKYNEFGSDRGKEYVSFIDAWDKYGNNKENFADVHGYENRGVDENSNTLTKDRKISKMIGGTAYKGQANDSQYYCENYKICPDVMPERFTNPMSNPQCTGPVEQKYNIPLVNPNKGISNYSDGMNAYTNQDNIMKQYASGGSKSGDLRCINPPQMYNAMYNNKDFDKGMYSALNQPTSCASPYNIPMRKIDMNNVKGYVEDGIDDYITMDESISNTQMIPLTRGGNVKNNSANFKDEKGTIFNPVMEQFMNQNNSGYGSGENNMQYILDIVLFILAGILIIFLCDQIYRIAALSGMKETIAMLKDLKD